MLTNILARNCLDRHRRYKFAAVLLLAILAALLPQTREAAAVTCPGGKVLNIVAHQDDDLIFFGAQEIADIKAGACVQTIYVTAGNLSLEPNGYWQRRETGTVAAHAKMANTGVATVNGSILIGPHVIAKRVLTANPRVTIVAMRLPDGLANSSLPGPSQLWDGRISTLAPVPDASADGLANLQSYTKPDLIYTLRVLISRFRPDKIRLQNYRDNVGSINDHDEHMSVARFAFAAARRYAALIGVNVSTLVTGYRGYQTTGYPQNISGATLAAKNAAFRAYGVYDSNGVCYNRDCSSFGTAFGDYPRWLSREYRLDDPTNESAFFEIRGLRDKCIDVENGFIEDGTPIQIWTCENVVQQKWRYDRVEKTLTDLNSGKCMAQAAAVGLNGSRVRLATCNGDPTQQWKFAIDGEIVSISGKCLDVASPTAVDGTDLRIWDCIYNPRQLWGYGRSATPIAPAHELAARILDSVTGQKLCMNEETTAFSVSAKVTVEPCNGSLAQKWRFTAGNTIRGKDGKCLSTITPGGFILAARPCGLVDDYPSPPNLVDGWEEYHHNGAPTIRIRNLQVANCAGIGTTPVTGQDVVGTTCIPGDEQEWENTPGFISPAP